MPIIFYPYLIAVYPVLALFAANKNKVSPADMLVPAILLLSATYLAQLILSRLLKNKHLSALIISAFIVFVFSYGGFSEFLHLHLGYLGFYKHSFRVMAYVPFSALIGFLVIWVFSRSIAWIKVLNFFSVILVALAIIPVVANYGQAKKNVQSDLQEATLMVDQSLKNESKEKWPDIYYIILDGYGRADILKEFFDFDNGSFLAFLQSRGFNISGNRRSNYTFTDLSVPSSLLMNYVGNIENIDWKGNEVKKFLKKKGYKYFDIGSEVESSVEKKGLLHEDLIFNEFNMLLLRQTVADAVAARFHLYSKLIRRKILANFDELKEMPEIGERKFVFAHILAAHPPYVFGPNGEDIRISPMGASMNVFKTPWDDKEGYINQLRFINKKTEEVIDILLKKSKHSPIIIVQGDHGPLFTLSRKDEIKMRMSILNAYYLPSGGDKALYDKITPVNSFRAIFSYYFHANLKLLEDKCYFSTIDFPDDREDVTETLS